MSLPSKPRAVVTGGAGGLGRAFALEIARRGGRVVIGDIDLAGAEETARLVQAAGGEAFALRCDVAQFADVETLAVATESRFGGVDLAINNAGVAVAGTVGEVPLADWRWIVEINLLGVVHGCHVFAPRLKARGAGHILNVASCAGLISTPGMAPYNMTKAGVVALSETMYAELAPFGVGVSVLCPTFFKTNIAANGRVHGDPGVGKLATKLMERSRIQAPEVARIAIDAVDAGELYVVPMADGRWPWRMKRFWPEGYYRWIVPRLLKLMRGVEPRA